MNVSRLPVVRGRPRLGLCAGGIGKIVCIGLNYTDHAHEVNLPLPKEPLLFIKANSSISGPSDAIVRPRGAVKLDYEVELGAVIGRDARDVSEADALKHVAAYCIVDDVSERAFQMEHGGTTTKGKSADTFAPVGPWLVTADEVRDPQAFEVWTTVNGESRQRGPDRQHDLHRRRSWRTSASLPPRRRHISTAPADVAHVLSPRLLPPATSWRWGHRLARIRTASGDADHARHVYSGCDGGSSDSTTVRRTRPQRDPVRAPSGGAHAGLCSDSGCHRLLVHAPYRDIVRSWPSAIFVRDCRLALSHPLRSRKRGFYFRVAWLPVHPPIFCRPSEDRWPKRLPHARTTP